MTRTKDSFLGMESLLIWMTSTAPFSSEMATKTVLGAIGWDKTEEGTLTPVNCMVLLLTVVATNAEPIGQEGFVRVCKGDYQRRPRFETRYPENGISDQIYY